MYVYIVLCFVTQSCPTLCDPIDSSPPGFSVHGDFPGKNTGVGCHALLQEIFPTQGSNPGLLHCRRILYCLSHQGSPHWAFKYLLKSFCQECFHSPAPTPYTYSEAQLQPHLPKGLVPTAPLRPCALWALRDPPQMLATRVIKEGIWNPLSSPHPL